MSITSPIIGVIDMKTLDFRSDAKIISIGVVVGNIVTGEDVEHFYTRICLDSQPRRTVSSSKITWWGQQKVVARKECFDDSLSRSSLQEGLSLLNAFLRDIADKHKIKHEDGIPLFGDGPELKDSALEKAMKYYKLSPSWRNGSIESTGILKFVSGCISGASPSQFIQHHALHDAMHEFDSICKATQALKSALSA